MTMITPRNGTSRVLTLALLATMLALLLLSSTTGCGKKPGDGQGPGERGAWDFRDRDPDIIGTVDKIAVPTAPQENVPPPPGYGERSVGILEIRAHPAYPSAHQAASVKVTGETEIVHEKSRKRLYFADLKKGMLVKVWFQGPVAESWPVQATAGKIEVAE